MVFTETNRQRKQYFTPPAWKLSLKTQNKNLQPVDTLLAWVKLVTFSRVLPVSNFTSCWKDGKIFCAILLRYLVITTSWEKILEMSDRQRLDLAFTTAETELKISPIIDASDVENDPVKGENKKF